MNQIDIIVENRKGILALCEEHGATEVRIFGSCARGQHDDKSDIDVLVRFPKTLSGFDYFGAAGALEDKLTALLGTKVDLVDEANLHGETRARILREAVTL